MTDGVEELRKKAFELTPREQYRLAFFITENLGYALTEEPDHPDSPHNKAEALMTSALAFSVPVRRLPE